MAMEVMARYHLPEGDRDEAGLLPFRWVGAHRRLRLTDVLTLKRREAPDRSALDALKDETDALIANGL